MHAGRTVVRPVWMRSSPLRAAGWASYRFARWLLHKPVSSADGSESGTLRGMGNQVELPDGRRLVVAFESPDLGWTCWIEGAAHRPVTGWPLEDVIAEGSV
jgi:hypothetical protein